MGLAEKDMEMTLKDKLKLLFSSAWDFLVPFVRLFLSRAGQEVLPLALLAVRRMAETMGQADGEAKRTAAFEQIKADAARKGLTVGVDVTTSLINAAIEVAVQSLKAR